jgi:hypothetical protein
VLVLLLFGNGDIKFMKNNPKCLRGTGDSKFEKF